MIVWTTIITHWASMDAFGTPYLRPFSPLRSKQFLREVLTRPLRQT